MNKPQRTNPKSNVVKLALCTVGLICERRKNKLPTLASLLICVAPKNFLSVVHIVKLFISSKIRRKSRANGKNKIIIGRLIVHKLDGNFDTEDIELSCSGPKQSISPETIREFKQIVEEEYGLVIDKTDASRILCGLTNFFDLLAKIDYREKIKDG
jgi:hypothetical protein